MEGILARSQYLLESGRWTDCKFLVGESPCQELVEAHKLYLVAASPVFETMFYGSMPEGTEPIRIPEVQAEPFKAMLKYIYSDELMFDSFEEARDLCYCAKKYMLRNLAAKCSEYMQCYLGPETACNIYEIAELFEEPELLRHCLNFICSETKKILTSISWENATKATVSMIFEQNSLAVDSENDLFEALLKWTKAECKRRSLPANQTSLRSISCDLLIKIRFLTLTPEQFSNGPEKTEILYKDEAYAIIMNILSASNSVPMPEGFSVEKKYRHKLDGDKQVCLATPITVSTPGNMINISCDSGPKAKIFCCHRPFASTFHFQYHALREYSLAFRVDRKIKIHGAVVPERSLRGTASNSGFYDEKIYACLLDRHKFELTRAHFATKRLRGNHVKIVFKPPVEIEMNEDYQIIVHFNIGGTCVLGKHCAKTAVCNQVEFSFPSRPPGSSTLDAPIRGILFSK